MKCVHVCGQGKMMSCGVSLERLQMNQCENLLLTVASSEQLSNDTNRFGYIAQLISFSDITRPYLFTWFFSTFYYLFFFLFFKNRMVDQDQNLVGMMTLIWKELRSKF